MKSGLIKIQVCLLVAALFFSNSYADENKLVFAGTPETFPFTYEENGVIKGIDIDLFREVAERTGIKVEIELLPFKREVYYLEEGKIDGTFQIFRNSEREQFLIYSEIPTRHIEYTASVKKGNPSDFKTVKDFYGKTVAKMRHKFISQEFDDAVRNGKIFMKEGDIYEDILKDVSRGKLDAFISNIYVTRFHINKAGLSDEIVQLSLPFTEKKPVYIALSKKGTKISDKSDLIKKISAAIKSLHEEGVDKKIFDKYLNK